MIRPEDLRIGNWLQDQSGYFKVRAIELGVTFLDEPITLTEEILVKAGCTIVLCGGCEYRLGNLTLQVTKYDSGNLITVFLGGELINLLHYLHELQNLVFALSNKELQIEL